MKEDGFKVVIGIFHEAESGSKFPGSRRIVRYWTWQIQWRWKFQWRLEWQSIEVMPTSVPLAKMAVNMAAETTVMTTNWKCPGRSRKYRGQHKLLWYQWVEHSPHDGCENQAQDVNSSQERLQSENNNNNAETRAGKLEGTKPHAL